MLKLRKMSDDQRRSNPSMKRSNRDLAPKGRRSVAEWIAHRVAQIVSRDASFVLGHSKPRLVFDSDHSARMPKPRQLASQKSCSDFPGAQCILRTVTLEKAPGSARPRFAVGSGITSALGSNMEAERSVEADWS